MSKIVHVELSERSYDIHIGEALVEEFQKYTKGLFPSAKFAIITDSNVANLHLDKLETILRKMSAYSGSIIVPAGENSKSFTQLIGLSEQLLEMNIERGDVIIAFGGGMIGDLAGFAASVLRRGVKFIQIPTTLLAQVDSSVGGKTGINTKQGKNLIGTFHQPSLVLADTGLLETLDDREFRAGYAEVVKYGLLGDAGFFEWLDQNWEAIFKNEGDARSVAIEMSCKAKAQVVSEDEKEAGRRALLNLGHTFGHAIEAWAGYSGRLLHGEGVAIGMTLAFQFSEEIGLCKSEDTQRVITHLKAVGLPTKIKNIPGDDYPGPELLWKHMQQDKKVHNGVPAFILVNGIGQAFVDKAVPIDKLKDFLRDACL